MHFGPQWIGIVRDNYSHSGSRPALWSRQRLTSECRTGKGVRVILLVWSCGSQTCSICIAYEHHVWTLAPTKRMLSTVTFGSHTRPSTYLFIGSQMCDMDNSLSTSRLMPRSRQSLTSGLRLGSERDSFTEEPLCHRHVL